MSSTFGMHEEEGRELSGDVDALAESLEASINQARLTAEYLINANSEQPSIPMVPKLLRGSESEAYEPKILSLGPYHHHKSHLQAMKQLKLLYLHSFLDRNRSISLRQYLTQVKERESEARMAYKDCNMASDDLVELLLLDCCFVLEIIWCWNNASGDVKQDGMHTFNPFVSRRYSFQVMQRDMLLLENQLPFFLIRHLFKSAYLSMANECLENLITKFFEIVVPGIMKLCYIVDAARARARVRTRLAAALPTDRGNHKYSPHSGGEFLRILHLVHCSISPEEGRHDDPVTRTRGPLTRLPSAASGNLQRSARRTNNREVHWIPCAVELSNAGIHFVRNDDKEKHRWWKLWTHLCSPSETPACSFLDITFEGRRMEIPKLKVDDDTDTILRNLIAFEQCYVKVKPHVTAYAMLMNYIINTEADVELLQQSGVLVNGLGDSKEVAILFNKLSKEVAMPDKCYSKVYGDVDRHCNTKCNRWRAKLNHDYFSNPWAIISLLAASLLFVLTITQTVYSILSYVKPKQR